MNNLKIIDDAKDQLETAQDALKEIKDLLSNYDEDEDNSNLTTIHGSTIEWNEEREGLNFTEREIMHTLDKLFYNGKTAQEILSHLESIL